MALKIGKYLFVFGLVITIIGLVAGFWLMYRDIDEWAKFFLMIVPVGFMIGFAGLTASLMSSPEERKKFNDSL